VLLLCKLVQAHTGIVMPWDSDEFDYATAPPDAWKVLDLHISVLIGVLLFSWLYLMAVTRWRTRYNWSEKPVESWRVVCFFAGQFILMLALNGPIHHLSDYYLFAAHMVQHLLLNLLWAPLTVLALPSWLIEVMLTVPILKKLSDGLGGLRVKFLVYNGVLYFWHIPFMYDLAIAEHSVHIVEHLSFMATAVIAWVGVLCDAPSLPKKEPIAQLVYLFGMTVPMKALGALITLSDELVYQGYVQAPRIWGYTPLEDQQLGGLLMWLPGGFALWGSMILVFSRWWRTEQERKKLETAAFLARQKLTLVEK
jgi:putative membrane protein